MYMQALGGSMLMQGTGSTGTVSLYLHGTGVCFLG